MSQPSRPWARGSAKRRRAIKPDTPFPLEQRCLLAPYVSLFPVTATFTAATTQTNADLGTVTVAQNSTATNISSSAPITSVAELTPLSSFGGDIVRIVAGPGGVFGNGLYAISRGSGGNTSAVNRPGVIYRIDPATGQASVFFDLNTVMSQIDPNALASDGKNPAANSLGSSTGYVNWYDIAFDAEGNFDGSPVMLVSSVDRSDPAKNAIYMISPSGQFLGAFVLLTDGLAQTKFNINPTGMVVPGPEDQAFLRGLLAGSGISTTGGTFAGLFFNANGYSPGQTISNGTLPTGVTQTGLTEGTIVGMTEANADYISPVYSAFTDFGTPAAGLIPATTGLSGVQGSNGELLIGSGLPATSTSLTLDQQGAASTTYRRFEDIAFDQYGYFSQDIGLSSTVTTNTTTNTTSTSYTVTLPPISAGNLFVSDLASGLSVTVTSVASGTAGQPGYIPAGVTVVVPVNGSGTVGVQLENPNAPYNATTNPLIPITSGMNDSLGGRIIQITPQGVVSNFAQGFDVSAATNYTSFINSELSITFSADGTTLWASDDQGIWQFKTTASLADSTTGTLIGLNDLRTLGVPYNGEGSAVAVIDTGVDGQSPPFRGRVATGKNVWTGGPGNQDLASNGTTTTGTTGTGTSSTGAGGTILVNTYSGHGTPVAGVVAQFVPQATIVPVTIFAPFVGTVTLPTSSSTGTTGTTGGTGGTGTSISATSNALTTSQALYQGLQYVAQHPYVNDPVRPGKVDRVVAATLAFGTTQTFTSEYTAYKAYPQVVIALKNQLHKFRKLGIAPIAASGQFGSPLGSSSSTTSTGTGGGTSGSGTGYIEPGFNNSDNSSLGDVNGMSLPGVLNEVISVTGTYPYPFTDSPSTIPTDPPVGVIPNLLGPLLVFGNALTIGGTATPTTSGTTGTGGAGAGGTGGTGTTTAGVAANVATYTAADILQYNDRITGAANRSATTDFAAPAIDVPTFRRTFSLTNTTTGTSTSAAGDPNNHLTFTQVGTSMSSAIVTGSYALVSSALNYWITLAQGSGTTSDAYLTTPVGVDSLSFGKHAFKNLTAYNTPDGINGILAYTAVPATDVNDAGTLSTPPLVSGTTSAPSYARVSVSNAIASIEGTIAINYLLAHKDFPLIDTNGDGLITAQELQDFTNTAASKGLAEAGAMAALLGGTATYAQPESGINNMVYNENPDQPAALQRRFNYFDYLANGQLEGGISISSFKMLANTLLPQPDSYVIIDRQRASANGFLVAPTAVRNFVDLQHLLPKYMFVPPSAIAKYRNISPTMFKVNFNSRPGTALPFYSLFGGGSGSAVTLGTPVVRTGTVNGVEFSVSLAPLEGVATSSSSTTSSTTTTPAASSTTTTTPAASSSSTTTTSSTPVTTTSTTPAAATGTSSSSSTTSSTMIPATDATTTTSSSTTETAAQALVAAAAQLASSQTTTSASPNSLVPAGTLTPVASTTATTAASTAATTAASTATTTPATTAASTATTTPATTTASTATTTPATTTASTAATTTSASDVTTVAPTATSTSSSTTPATSTTSTTNTTPTVNTTPTASTTTASTTPSVAPLTSTATPVGSDTQTPIQAASANKKEAARLAAAQKKATEKQSFWTKLVNSIK